MSEESTSGLSLGQVVWRRLIGKRLLVKESGSQSPDLFEYTVCDVSPSGLRVKFKNSAGRTFWTANDQYLPMEVLP